MAGKNIYDIFSGGNHSFFLLDYDNKDISDYEEPSPLNSIKI